MGKLLSGKLLAGVLCAAMVFTGPLSVLASENANAEQDVVEESVVLADKYDDYGLVYTKVKVAYPYLGVRLQGGDVDLSKVKGYVLAITDDNVQKPFFDPIFTYANAPEDVGKPEDVAGIRVEDGHYILTPKSVGYVNLKVTVPKSDRYTVKDTAYEILHVRIFSDPTSVDVSSNSHKDGAIIRVGEATPKLTAKVYPVISDAKPSAYTDTADVIWEVYKKEGSKAGAMLTTDSGIYVKADSTDYETNTSEGQLVIESDKLDYYGDIEVKAVSACGFEGKRVSGEAMTFTIRSADAPYDYEDQIVVKGYEYTISDFKKAKSISYSKKGIVKIDKATGKVSVLKNGTTTATVKMSKDKSYLVKFVVVNPEFKADTIYPNKGDSVDIGFDVKGIKDKVTYKSSNTKVASINKKGVVKAKKAGETTVTATVQGKKFTCTVAVVDPKIDGTSTVKKGKKITLSIKNGHGKTKWVSSNKKIATVSSKGVVKGIKKGKVTITATNNGKQIKKKITVK